MRNPFARWRALERPRPVELRSPLQVPVAAERLAGAMRSARFGGPLSDDRTMVLGRVSRSRVRAVRHGARNSWRPAFEGSLVVAPLGSRLVGRLGWPRSVRVLTWSMLAFCSLWSLSTAVGLVLALLHGNSSAALSWLVFVGVGLVLTGALVGMSVAGTQSAARAGDGQFLLAWLGEQLECIR